MRTLLASKTQRRLLPLLATVVTALIVVPSAAGTTVYHTRAVDQTDAEINVPTDALPAVDVEQVYTGSFGSRSNSWVSLMSPIPDLYPVPLVIFTNFDLECNPEEPQFWETYNFQNECWSAGLSFYAERGEWGELLRLTATAADGVTPVVFDHWNVTNAAPMKPMFVGQVPGGQGVPGYCTTGERGVRTTPLGSFTGAAYQSYMERTASTEIGLDVEYQGVYVPASPDTTAPLVTIAPLLDCSAFVQNSTQTASYSCIDPGYPALTGPTDVASCDGKVDGVGVANGDHLPTATLGPHTLTVTGIDGKGNTRTQTATYTVVPPPSISSKSSAFFTQGTAGSFTVTTSGFAGKPVPVLAESGALPSGVKFVDNVDGTATLSGTPTDGPGSYPVTITAASSISPSASPDNTNGYLPDATQSLTISVVSGPPLVSITRPTSGAVYVQGEAQEAEFECTEPAGGAGTVPECEATLNGVAIMNGESLTQHVGHMTLQVTARSEDGLETTGKVEYQVKEAMTTGTCSQIRGSGHISPAGKAGENLRDHLNTGLSGREYFSTTPPHNDPGFLRLIKLDAATCTKTPTEALFSGNGSAAMKGKKGLLMSFAFRQAGGHTYLTLDVLEGAKSIYIVKEAQFSPASKETIR